MARASYSPSQSYIGTGSLTAYSFSFKIESLTQLLVIVMDDLGVEFKRVRGNDTTYLSSVTYDNVDGGGTVNLLAVLPTNYTILILQANDAPTQPFEFKNKTTFNLRSLELALDFVVGAVQRLAYLVQRSFTLHESDNPNIFSPRFPAGISEAENYDRYLKIKSDGTGFEYGLTSEELITAAMPTPTVEGQIVRWNGTDWEAVLYSGQTEISDTQDINNNGVIALNGAIKQMLKVQGNGGSQSASTTPFGNSVVDGTTITVVGMSDSNILKIPYADINKGCVLKGDCYLGRYSSLTVVFDAGANRFIEIARN
jgi:hypothetical protein